MVYHIDLEEGHGCRLARPGHAQRQRPLLARDAALQGLCVYVCMYVCVWQYVYICMYMYVYVCIYVYACMYVCMHVCMCMYVCV